MSIQPTASPSTDVGRISRAGLLPALVVLALCLAGCAGGGGASGGQLAHQTYITG